MSNLNMTNKPNINTCFVNTSSLFRPIRSLRKHLFTAPVTRINRYIIFLSDENPLSTLYSLPS